MVIVEAHAIGTGTISYKNAQMSVTDEGDSKAPKAKRDWTKLNVQQDFHVVEPLHLVAPFAGPLVLPPDHSFKLDIAGGSGDYTFALEGSAPERVCVVSASGLVQAASTLGSAKIVVADKRNSANTISVTVFVRQVASVFLRPPYSQLQVAGDVAEGHVSVPIFARPAPIKGDDDAAWDQLRFWNCSALQAVLSAQTSSSEVLSAELASPVSVQDAGAGACNVISVLPRVTGNATLTAFMKLARIQLEASAKLQVYAPLRLGSKDIDESHAGQPLEMRIAPCSSATLSLLQGPSSMTVPGRVFQNLSTALEGTHLRLRSAGQREFEVLCLRPTPGRVQVFAEVRQEPSDTDVYGGPVVAQASAWITCAVPVAAYVVPMKTADGALPARPRSNGTVFGLRQGQVHRFGARLFDAEGQSLVASSVYESRWVINGDGVRQWLDTDAQQHAVISVPTC